MRRISSLQNGVDANGINNMLRRYTSLFRSIQKIHIHMCLSYKRTRIISYINLKKINMSANFDFVPNCREKFTMHSRAQIIYHAVNCDILSLIFNANEGPSSSIRHCIKEASMYDAPRISAHISCFSFYYDSVLIS